MGPDPAIPGGMSTALRALVASPLSERYELEMLPTYRSPAPLPRLGIFLLSLLRLTLWSLRGRGRIVHVHTTVRASTYRKALVTLLAKGLRRRVVLHSHSGAVEIARYRALHDPLSLRLLRAGFGAADRVLAVSEVSAAALRDAYGVDEVVVVPNPAPPVVELSRPEPGPDGPAVAYLGGFANPAKGADVLVPALSEALEAAPGLPVTLAGPGEPSPPAAALIAAHPNVEWVGYLDPEGRDRLLRRAEVFVMSSRSEGLPMALLEAMSYGMAVLATRVGGIPEVVADGAEGLLVEPGDAAALAAALRRLIADPELRARLAAAARARVARLDDVEVARRLQEIYAGLEGKP
jgi:glycosyltransferase involved in cell wall biosynthesis